MTTGLDHSMHSRLATAPQKVPGPMSGRAAERASDQDAGSGQRSALPRLRPSAVPPYHPGPDPALALVDQALDSPGMPLGAGIRGQMEQRLGADFGQVRIHADEHAAASAQALGAAAYTVGDSIVFAPGRYAPAQAEGRELLAHELVHTIQQGASGSPGTGRRLGVEPPESPAEAEARAIARTSLAGGLPHAAPGTTRRSPKASPSRVPPRRVIQWQLLPEVTDDWAAALNRDPSSLGDVRRAYERLVPYQLSKIRAKVNALPAKTKEDIAVGQFLTEKLELLEKYWRKRNNSDKWLQKTWGRQLQEMIGIVNHLARHLGIGEELTGSFQAKPDKIFLRRGEYHPGSTADQRLLAPELTHVAQQAGGAVNADGVSGPPLGVAPAGVIQRMKIGDHDTETGEGLVNLRRQVRKMEDLSDIRAMQSEIAKKIEDGELRTDNVKELLGALNRRELTVEAGKKQEVPESNEPKSGGAMAELVSTLTKSSGQLTDLAAKLKAGPGDETGAVETWLQSVDNFLQEHEKWQEEFKKLPLAARRSHRPTLWKPLRDQADELDARSKGIRKREQARNEAIAESKQEETAKEAAITKRKQEAAAGEELVSKYVKTLEYKVGSLKAQDWADHAETLSGLFLKWIFPAAIAEADKVKDSSQWVAALLNDLKGRRTPDSGLWVTVIGQKGNIPASGESNANWIKLYFDLSNIDLLDFLAGEGPHNVSAREKFVTGTASTFIHEAAHVRQMQAYDNSSYPWKASMQHGGFALGAPKSKGVRFEHWTPEVQEAFKELKQGGSKEQAKNDTTWHDKFTRLEGYHQDKGSQEETDERAAELVSHLMEIVYAWHDDKKFREIFPLGAALLDKVIKPGA
jgi:hypothetical protein